MSTTLTYGRVQPANGERNFWTDLNGNIAKDDAHTHDGVTSPLLPAKNITKATTSIASASWAAVVGQAGTYKQTITTPTGISVDTMMPRFVIASGGDTGQQVMPSVRKVTATTYDVYINDNTLNLTAVYG